jgi:hypothetical protein
VAAVEVQKDFFLDCEVEAARHVRPGRYTARLAGAGSALMMPDLIQNIADRPLDEVLFFFGELKRLPLRPTVESLRDVMSWYKDGFLDDMPYEDDPVGAWAKCGSAPLHLLLVSPRRVAPPYIARDAVAFWSDAAAAAPTVPHCHLRIPEIEWSERLERLIDSLFSP